MPDGSRESEITDSALDLNGDMGYLVEVGAEHFIRKTASWLSARLACNVISGTNDACDWVLQDAKDGRLTAERVE